MTMPRTAHSAFRLPDGKVLVVGGSNEGGTAPGSAELFDPGTGTWSPARSMSTARVNFAAAMLTDGKVLITGGWHLVSGTALNTAEQYDPATGLWSPIAAMGTPRYNQTATRLADGRILVSGGVNNDNQGGIATAELYDPSTNLWAPTGSMAAPRETDEAGGHPAVLLPATGDILAIGGSNNLSGILNTAERYRPGTGIWSATPALDAARQGHTATLLGDGTVLVVSGLDDFGPVASNELYDPATNAWSAAAPPLTPRSGHSATALLDGQVLVVGGTGAGGVQLVSAELFQGP